jgi:hypothetical protein
MGACLSITLEATEVRTTTIMKTTSSTSSSSVDPDLLEFKKETKVSKTETQVKTELNRTTKMLLNQSYPK